MKVATCYAIWACVVGALFLTTTSRAQAYIDPGTGSYLLQAMAAGILAALFIVKGFWSNIKRGVAHIIVRRSDR